MKCEQDKEQLTLYMNNQLTAEQRAAVERHITECADCKAELEASLQVWQLMDEVPEPELSPNIQLKFNVMLDVYKKEVAGKKSFVLGVREKFKQLFTFSPAFTLAYSVMVLVVGISVGLLVNKPAGSTVGPVTDTRKLAEEVHNLKESVTLALLQNPSASERIKGVSYTSEIQGDKSNIIKALFVTLNNDDNPNVRLVTLEALVKYANEPAVREGLIQSIEEQDSPLVQSALADVMLKLQEKRSVQPFKKLLQQKDLNVMVRDKIQETITQLHI